MRFSAGLPGSSSSAGRAAGSPSSAESTRSLVARARVARLATIDADGRPHLVPIVFAIEGDTLYSAVDSKPKRSRTLRRIENARIRPDVTVLVDCYDDDWARLWWVRLRGRARVLDGGDEANRAIARLTTKYAPYRDNPPRPPVLAIDVQEWREWGGGQCLPHSGSGNHQAVTERHDTRAGSDAAALAELASALAGAESLEQLCTRALQAVRSSLGVDRASVLLLDEDGVLRFRAWDGLSDRYRAATEGHSPWVLDTQEPKPVVVSDVASEPELEALREVVLEEGIRALAFVPIAFAGRLLGKYMLYFDRARELRPDELILAGAVADQIAVAVEQRRVADELRTSHEQLEVIFRGVGEGVTVQRPDGTLAYANDRAARLLGFDTADELLATPPTEIIARFEVLDEDGRPFPFDRFPGRRVLGGEEEVEETFLWRRRDTGEEHWSVVKATAVRGADGQVLFAVNLFRDVTALRRREDWRRFLADSGEILNASFEYEATARELARLVVPLLADWCAVDVVLDDGPLQQIALAHVDPDRVRWAQEVRERYPSDDSATTGVPRSFAAAEQSCTRRSRTRCSSPARGTRLTSISFAVSSSRRRWSYHSSRAAGRSAR